MLIKLISKKRTTFISNENILTAHQNGYKLKKSTEDEILDVIENNSTNLCTSNNSPVFLLIC